MAKSFIQNIAGHADIEILTPAKAVTVIQYTIKERVLKLLDTIVDTLDEYVDYLTEANDTIKNAIDKIKGIVGDRIHK